MIVNIFSKWLAIGFIFQSVTLRVWIRSSNQLRFKNIYITMKTGAGIGFLVLVNPGLWPDFRNQFIKMLLMTYGQLKNMGNIDNGWLSLSLCQWYKVNEMPDEKKKHYTYCCRAVKAEVVLTSIVVRCTSRVQETYANYVRIHTAMKKRIQVQRIIFEQKYHDAI